MSDIETKDEAYDFLEGVVKQRLVMPQNVSVVHREHGILKMKIYHNAETFRVEMNIANADVSRGHFKNHWKTLIDDYIDAIMDHTTMKIDGHTVRCQPGTNSRYDCDDCDAYVNECGNVETHEQRLWVLGSMVEQHRQ